jgi:segregation and condensation protein B
MEPIELAAKLEALLFALGRPLSRSELAKMLGADGTDITAAVALLQENPRGGIAVVDDDKEVELRVAGESAGLIEQVRKEEYSRDIGKAGLESLAAILYRGPLSRSEIDFIRGVNSSQTLRTLTLRGLVRRIPNPRDERSFLYEPTTELLAELGVTRIQELPDYAEVRHKLETLEEAYRQQASQKQTNEAIS